jgi:hypothetical protein
MVLTAVHQLIARFCCFWFQGIELQALCQISPSSGSAGKQESTRQEVEST